MPKKGAGAKKGGAANTKAKQAAAKKKIEDATFGMKNKNKSRKVAEYQKQVEKSVESQFAKKEREKTKKELKREKEEELRKIIKPVEIKQKVEAGVDPKSVLCDAFRAGKCQRGDKCRFSHDLAVERRGAKIDMYTDRRDVPPEGDTMEGWDESTLRSVVDRKASKNRECQTDIVCKYFIKAIEEKKYGWFWECQNGPSCKYRHALPPGFVFESERKRAEEEDDGEPIEDLLEAERQNLTGPGTPMTYEIFVEWKARKRAAKELEEKERIDAATQSKNLAGMTGREMFEFKPELFLDDESSTSDVLRMENSTSVEQNKSAKPFEEKPAEPTKNVEEEEEKMDTAAKPAESASASHSAPISTAEIDASLFEDDDDL